jgi:hypothetical protein
MAPQRKRFLTPFSPPLSCVIPFPIFPLPLEGVEKHQFAVIPAEAGIPKHLKPTDSCFRRNDSEVEILH